MINILSITPIDHIKNIRDKLKKIGKLKILKDPTSKEVEKKIYKFDAIFTNPNKSKVYLGKKILDKAKKLKTICTASTGTNHIDIEYANKKKIKVISLKKEKKVTNKISSTAEHALALTLASLRNVPNSSNSVLLGHWDYTNFIGRQINFLTVGVVGFGRLGKKYASYCKALGAKVIFYDPFIKKGTNNIKKISNFKKFLKSSDIISIHVHLDKKTYHMFNKKIFPNLNKEVIIVNTSRGDIVNEKHLINLLTKNKKMKFATDVLENEIFSKKNNNLVKFAKKRPKQLLITPHIGGMTTEAQEIAYGHAVKKLNDFFYKS